jgi:galactitol PTS system EIIA component
MVEVVQLDENVISLDVKVETNEEIIRYLYEKLRDFNYVKETFIQAILEREKVYPTGLPLGNTGVAIPHTDPEHVISPMLAFARLKNPVTFQMMGNKNETVQTDFVFMLAIKEPEKQLVMLERLMGIFQVEGTMSSLKTATSVKEVSNLLYKELNQVRI